MKLRTGLTAVIIAGAGALLASCADEKALDAQYDSIRLGQAVREDMTAQIADPDATYKGPPPPSNGEHADSAIKRYQNDKVTPPSGGVAGGGGGGPS
jgi:hypothetical protein